jgi:hypothetical protein
MFEKLAENLTNNQIIKVELFVYYTLAIFWLIKLGNYLFAPKKNR